MVKNNYIHMEKLDVRGKVCPLPLFYAKRKISDMKPREELEVITDDRTAKETIPKWCNIHDQEIVSIEEEGGCVRIRIRKK
jgi:tRNA 2-thiouridine synthesizing protein A